MHAFDTRLLLNIHEILVCANMAAMRKLTLCQKNLAFLQPQQERRFHELSWELFTVVFMFRSIPGRGKSYCSL